MGPWGSLASFRLRVWRDTYGFPLNTLPSIGRAGDSSSNLGGPIKSLSPSHFIKKEGVIVFRERAYPLFSLRIKTF